MIEGPQRTNTWLARQIVHEENAGEVRCGLRGHVEAILASRDPVIKLIDQNSFEQKWSKPKR